MLARSMNIRDSSEEEDFQNISAFTKFDESIEVRNAEEIKSPVARRASGRRRNSRSHYSENTILDVNSPRGKLTYNKRYIIFLSNIVSKRRKIF